MILPQLEVGNDSVKCVGMFFFDDNAHTLRKRDPVGERRAKIATENNILLMSWDECALRRGLVGGEFSQCGSGEVSPKDVVDGVQVGCFPQLCGALAPAAPDQVITLESLA